jgi:predicted MFS family arabinose efflux permease
MLAHYLGWRACLQVIGLAGLPLAALVFFTVPETRRPRPKDVGAEPTRQALGALWRRPAFVHLTIAYGFAAVANMGIGQWNPTFLIRCFGFSMAQIGVWAGLATAAGSVLGLLGGGLASTWLARRDGRWELWLPAIATGGSFPLAIMMALSPTVWMVLTCKIAFAVMSSISSVVAMTAVQSLVEPHRRATAISLVIFLYSVLGLGLGPYIIGLTSDLLTPTVGRDSLRYGILVASLFLPWSACHYVFASRRSAEVTPS